MRNFHVAIIGAGVVGTSIAWELSKYNLDVIVFEKGLDVCSGTSKANSGVIHSGINSKPDSLKAHFCVQGNEMIRSLAQNLGFSVNYVGKYVIAKNEREISHLEKLVKIGIKNKVTGLQIHEKKEVLKKEPNIECVAGLWVPSAGIILPYEFTICLAENAAINDVKFLLETEVKNLKFKKNKYLIETNNGEYQADIVINAAGLNCRNIVSFLEEPKFDIYPCRGEYLVLDKICSKLINSMIYPVPTDKAGFLGVHITPTIEGNILLGPGSEYIDDSNDTKTTKEMMNTLLRESKEILPKISKNNVINAYSGIRCKLSSEKEKTWMDYNIYESKNNSGFISLIGIESPGLTAAPAIAKEVVKTISKYKKLVKKESFKTINKKPKFNELPKKQQIELIKKDPSWGRIVCRCEKITEAEVISALSNPLGAKSFSSVKYRCRAGMGRCQGGFCSQHIVRILQERFKMNIDEIKLKSTNSQMFLRKNRDGK
jgi:glycerol-3-phosphate dehydrogenase